MYCKIKTMNKDNNIRPTLTVVLVAVVKQLCMLYYTTLYSLFYVIFNCNWRPL